ncbi:MAG: exodeoxyribonuclease VII small subunit [Betaproteobacteria bacterium HGW-Betaproteobacteria-11]|nr:MAG: exodeoxyribonuclease VII small subunit [Betaproteobacteria bacterium HGW-Betaproteobacteria-11]
MSPKPHSFETSLSELEAIITAMEIGQMTLQETLDAYKRGIALLRHCQTTLDSAEQQTRILENGVLRDLESDTANPTDI